MSLIKMHLLNLLRCLKHLLMVVTPMGSQMIVGYLVSHKYHRMFLARLLVRTVTRRRVQVRATLTPELKDVQDVWILMIFSKAMGHILMLELP